MHATHKNVYLKIACVTWVMFVTLSYLVWDANDMLVDINQSVYEYIIYSDLASYRHFWTFITIFGGVQVLGILTIISLFYFIYKKDRADVYLYLVSMLGGVISVGILKYLTASERPGFIYAIEESFSFPSGHTALSTIFLILTSYVYVRDKKNIHKKIMISLAIILSILIAISRLYLGEHWIADVLGGYIFALAWSSTAIYLYRYFAGDKTKK